MRKSIESDLIDCTQPQNLIHCYDIFTKRMIDYRRSSLMKTRRSRTPAIKITSINKPDPVLAAQFAVPLLLKFVAKKNASHRSSDIALYDAAKAADDGTRIPAEVVHAELDGAHPVKAWRDYRKLTQQELVDKAGISKSFLSQIETKKRVGTIKVLSSLAKALDVPVDLLTE